jgi:hypothetical protein
MKMTAESLDARMLKWAGLALAGFLGVSLLSAGARADEPPPGPGPGPHRGPPPAAFDACKGKSQGDACEVTFREHKITGKCEPTRESTLACRPDHPPGPPPGR